jgi:Tol biopolymer transport system component
MTTDRSLERDLRLVLDQTAATHEPERMLDSVLSTTGRMRPRPRWLTLIKEPPMRFHAALAFGSPSARLAAVTLTTLALLALAAGSVLAAATLLSNTDPTSPGLVRNGLIAFDSNGDIMVADPDGTDPRVLVGGPDEDTSPVWSPDGTMLAFWNKPDGTSLLRLGLVDGRGGAPRYIDAPAGRVFAGYQFGESNIDWGPGDGRVMVRTSTAGANHLYLLDLTTESYEGVALGDRRGRFTSFDWSDDGTKIAFVSWDDAPHYEFIFVTDLDGSAPRQLIKADPVEGSLASVRWDPDGRRLTYSRGDHDPAYDGSEPGQLQRTETSLYVLDTETGVESLVRQGRFYMPVWSPSGERIAYGAQDVIGIVGPDGSNPVPLGIAYVSPPDITWSPDGTKVASVASTDELQTSWRVVIVDAAGGVPTYIDAPGMVSQPSWQAVP